MTVSGGSAEKAPLRPTSSRWEVAGGKWRVNASPSATHLPHPISNKPLLQKKPHRDLCGSRVNRGFQRRPGAGVQLFRTNWNLAPPISITSNSSIMTDTLMLLPFNFGLIIPST